MIGDIESVQQRRITLSVAMFFSLGAISSIHCCLSAEVIFARAAGPGIFLGLCNIFKQVVFMVFNFNPSWPFLIVNSFEGLCWPDSYNRHFSIIGRSEEVFFGNFLCVHDEQNAAS